MSMTTSHWVAAVFVVISVIYMATHRGERRSEMFSMLLQVLVLGILLVPFVYGSASIAMRTKGGPVAYEGHSSQSHWKHV